MRDYNVIVLLDTSIIVVGAKMNSSCGYYSSKYADKREGHTFVG